MVPPDGIQFGYINDRCFIGLTHTMTMSRLRGADVAPFPSLPRVLPWPSHPLCFTLHISMQMQENTVTVGDAYHPVSLCTLLVNCSFAYADAVFDSSTSLNLHYSLARLGSSPCLCFQTPPCSMCSPLTTKKYLLSVKPSYYTCPPGPP